MNPSRSRALRISVRAYQTLLRAYPEVFRVEYGGEMTRCFQDLSCEALASGGTLGLTVLWVRTLPELLFTSLKERRALLNSKAYVTAASGALGAGLLLAWLSLGVGIIGRDSDPANHLYFTVLAVGTIGPIFMRFSSSGMTRSMFTIAFIQAFITAIALVSRWGYPWSGPLELIVLKGVFVGIFAGSALLFRHAAQG